MSISDALRLLPLAYQFKHVGDGGLVDIVSMYINRWWVHRHAYLGKCGSGSYSEVA